MIWDVRLTASDSIEDGMDSPLKFQLDPDSPQYLVLAFPTDSVNPNKVLYDVARFNFSSFMVKDFDLEPMSFSNVGLLVVKGFGNLREAEHYLTVMGNPTSVFPGGASDNNKQSRF